MPHESSIAPVSWPGQEGRRHGVGPLATAHGESDDQEHHAGWVLSIQHLRDASEVVLLTAHHAPLIAHRYRSADRATADSNRATARTIRSMAEPDSGT